MTNDEIRAGLDEAATWPGGRGTGAGIPAHTPWCASGQGYPCNCDDALYDAPSPTPEQRKQAEREAEEEQPRHWHEELWTAIAAIKRVFGNQTEINSAAKDALQAQIGINAELRAADDAQADMLAEQAATIAEQADIIDQLHAANKHLAGRFDKVEREFAEWRSRQGGINQDVYRTIDRECGKLALASVSGDNAADQRIQARAIELGHRIDDAGKVTMAQTRALGRLDSQIKRIIAAVPMAGEPTIQQQCDAVTYKGPTEEDNRE